MGPASHVAGDTDPGGGGAEKGFQPPGWEGIIIYCFKAGSLRPCYSSPRELIQFHADLLNGLDKR